MDRTKRANLGKFIGRTIAHAKGGKALDYLKKFKDPVHNFEPSKVKGKIELPKMQNQAPGFSPAGIGQGVRTSVGNTADSISKLTADVKGKGLLGGTAQVGKNVYNLGKSQMKGDLHKEVFDAATYRKNGKEYAKSKWAFGKDREVMGETSRGSKIIRRRKLYDPISLVAGGSGPAIGVGSYAFGDKNQSQTKRISNAAIDTALFSTSVPLGIGATLMRGASKEVKKNKQNKLKENI